MNHELKLQRKIPKLQKNTLAVSVTNTSEMQIKDTV